MGRTERQRCGGAWAWFLRWRHRRLRRLDEARMRPLLARQTAWMDPARRDERRRALWTTYCAFDGKEHWRCACAERDGVAAPDARTWGEAVV